ncbi:MULTISPECIES: type VI secretion system baseplate subunit TssF [unclassified Caballeronia]|uniref:type VI secretion system baseplate subunit TssF n=1 Tax=unclassified Caballeronia TaxID=2646786 RepID=UPI002029A236|nr:MULTISPECIES: type VI secretion system baseplate subunit TssF [unclassified Caballeronia]
MNPAFLKYYSQELRHLREMGGEFAAAFPKVAGRLALDGLECADPYVERLLEGFSFLAARVQMKLDAEFPRFTQHLLEMTYPHYLAPTPSMAVVQLMADHANPQLAASANGIVVPRHTVLRSMLDASSSTRCEFRTAHAVTLWPVEIAQAKFVTQGASASAKVASRAALRLRLRATGTLGFDRLALDRLVLHLRGADGLALRIHERLLAGCAGVAVVQPGKNGAADTTLAVLPKTALRPLGFAEDEALLPVSQQSFDGYRLLQEYFAFAPRFLFVEIAGLRDALRHCREREVEIVVLLDQTDASLERAVDAAHFALNCTPAINLFRRRTDRIALTHTDFEYHVVVDRTRPMDYEIHHIEDVTGYGSGAETQRAFRPFYCAKDLDAPGEGGAFYQLRREARRASVRQQRDGARSGYLGSEAFIALVDAASAPLDGDVRQLGITAWCTNRDLPLAMPLGAGTTDFTLDAEAPVTAVRCLAGPSRPLPSFAQGPAAWRLLDHLSLNYASLVDHDAQQGARALRELLALYCPADDAAALRQIEGLRSVSSEPVVRRLPSPGPIVFGRGLAVTLNFDDAAFEGASAFLLGAVLAQFMAQYVSINSFAETAVATLARGCIMRWPHRSGRCPTL